jgi:hypothetical protein
MRSARLRRFIVGEKQGAQSAHAKDLLLYGQSRRLTAVPNITASPIFE